MMLRPQRIVGSIVSSDAVPEFTVSRGAPETLNPTVLVGWRGLRGKLSANQSVSSVRIARRPARASASAAAMPPTPAPVMATSPLSEFMGGVSISPGDRFDCTNAAKLAPWRSDGLF